MDTSKTLATPVPFVVGDKTYKLSPLTYDDQAEFEQFLRRRALVALEQVRASIPVDRYNERFDALIDRFAAGLYAFGGEICKEATKSIPGVKEMFFLALVKNHPEATRQTVDEIFEAKAREAVVTLGAVNADPFPKVTAEAAPAV